VLVSVAFAAATACSSSEPSVRSDGPAATSSSGAEATSTAPATTARPSTTTSTEPPTSTSTTSTTLPPTTATTAPADPALPPPPPSNETDVLGVGSHGPRTQQLQALLTALHYDPGPIDGSFGTKTVQAVWAFQHLHGLSADGKVGPDVWAAITSSTDPAPQRPDGGPNHTEIDIGRQVLILYENSAVRLITHISTGSGRHYCDGGSCGTAITPKGDFTYLRRISGWHTSPLGELYNAIYFHGGYAVHGSNSVPNSPQSHGCVRLPMHIAAYFPSLVANGDSVFVY
jgi:peptidoglycan hydrolase-like protein with peptidoglycan-binding domain